MATAEQLKRQKDALTRAIKPATTQKQAEANMYRTSLLEKLNNPTVTTTKTGDKPTLGGLEGRPDTKTTNKSIDQTTIATTPYYYGKSGSSLGGKTVKDPTTGKVYRADSSKGQALVEQYGFTDAPVEPTAPATYAEIGEANLAAEANTLNQFGYDLGLEADQFLTPLEEAKRQIQIQREAKLAQEAQIDEQQQQLEYDTGAAKRSAESALDTTVAQLTGSREGVTSLSNVSASDKLKEATGLQMSRLLASQDASNAALDQARVQLAEAERSGNQAIIQNARNALLAAEQDAMATETAYVNALTMASEEERNVQAQKNANLAAFTGLVDSGEVMTTSAISNMAAQLGVPFEAANDYYEGAQAIRDDKSLDLEAKQTELANLQYDFNNKLAGIESEEAKSISNYMKLVQSGQYSEKELSMFAASMGIPNEKNPVYQADLAVKQAEAKIKTAEANGVLTNPLDLIDLAQKTYDYYETMGMNPSLIPTGGEYGAVSFTTPEGYQGVRFNVQDGVNYDNPSTTRDESQCGAFVNDVTGIGMGDSFTQKMSLVDKSLTVPAAGMVYVQAVAGPYAKNGHTGMVEYFNPQTGMVGTVSANSKGDGKIVREEIPLSTILNGGGFANPPKSMSADAVTTLDAVDKDLRTAVTTKANQFDSEPPVRNFQTIQEGYNYLKNLDPENLTSSDNQSIIYAFAKIMDPNSVVRESEYDTVQKYAQSLAATYGFDAQRLLTNTEFLTPEAVKNMIDTVEGRYDASKQSYDNLRNEYIRNINNLAGGVDIGNSVLQNYSTSNPAQETDPEEEYLNTLVDYGTNADLYDYIDSKTTTGNKSFRFGIGSLSSFKK